LKSVSSVFMLALLVSAGCATSGPDAGITPRPLGAGVKSFRPTQDRKQHTFVEPSGQVALPAVLAAALMGNPDLRAYSWEIRAAEARVLQAGMLPNPELEAEAEEFGGQGELTGFDGSATSLCLSQLIELGGKRSRRKQVASLERRLAGWDYEASRLDVLTETAKRFLVVLKAQQHLKLEKQSAAIAQKVNASVEARVAAGKVSPLEKVKAAVEIASSRIKLERSRRQLEVSRRRLAAQWGSISPGFVAVKGLFRRVANLPGLPKLLNLAEDNPDMARWSTEVQVRQAALKLQQANRVPDVELSAGVSRFEESGDHAFAAGFSIPLPLFDRNQGGLREARMNLRKVIEEKRAARVAIVTGITATYEELLSYAATINLLENNLLPAARKAFDAAGEGYAQGKFNYLEVLDAQRTLVEARSQHLEVMADYHRAILDMERFIGRSIAKEMARKGTASEAVEKALATTSSPKKETDK